MSDKVEIDLEDLDDLKDILGEERKGTHLNFQKVFAHVVLNWQWYVLSLVICMSAAYIYLRYAQPIYQVSAKMLVKDEDKKPRTSIRQILPNMLRRWKQEFLENASVVFDDTREDNLREKLTQERREKQEYAKKVGQLTMQVDWLKKKSEETFGPDYETKFSPKPFDD